MLLIFQQLHIVAPRLSKYNSVDLKLSKMAACYLRASCLKPFIDSGQFQSSQREREGEREVTNAQDFCSTVQYIKKQSQHKNKVKKRAPFFHNFFVQQKRSAVGKVSDEKLIQVRYFKRNMRLFCKHFILMKKKQKKQQILTLSTSFYFTENLHFWNSL